MLNNSNTIKLYYSDSHIYEFNASVLEVNVCDNRQIVILNRTAFFPGGGGQLYDIGYINNAKVISVYENKGIIFHCCELNEIIIKDSLVFCRLDKDTRFRRMQAHSGEHLVSGIAHNLYGTENVGFHMDDLLMTVDFDKHLDKHQINVIETEANKCVYMNIPVVCTEYSGSEYIKSDYRSKKEFSDAVRIVEIQNIDRCACCAPHVKYTGEIGVIKILSCISHRGGVRITLICGEEAYKDYCIKYNQALNIAAMLAAKHNELSQAINQLLDANSNLKVQLNEQIKRYCQLLADNITINENMCMQFYHDLTAEELRITAVNVMNKFKGLVILCSGDDINGYSYVICKKEAEVNKAAKKINTALNGRGGGRDELIQGSFKCSENDIKNYFNNMEIDI